MRVLSLWDDYTREEVHGIFSPNTRFTPQAGTWGLQGIVRVPARQGDFVFFVTFGKEQGDHVFDESITTDGVLSWQSQPGQGLNNATIKELIAHDDRVNAIHLFLRTKEDIPYTYLGTLGYLTHDQSRERPVHFQWQLLDWPPPAGALERIGLALQGTPAGILPTRAAESPSPTSIRFVDVPRGKVRGGVSTDAFRGQKAPDYAAQDARNRALGLKGEELVITIEKQQLSAAGREDLANQVVHVSTIEGDSAGYDVRSFTPDGSVRYIEVKTTRGPADTRFFMSANEVEFSRQNGNSYALYRLFNFGKTGTADAYVLEGDVTTRLTLKATQFRVELQPDDT